jgi:hypothetical protein
MARVVWFVVGVAACVGLVYLGYRIEPHWVAKDGSRFLTTSQVIDHEGRAVSRRREVRGTIMGDGLVMLGHRSMLRTRSSLWRVVARDDPPRGRSRFVLDPVPADPFGEQLVLRVPRSSRLVAQLDALVPPAAT